jgi:catechol 2,3-dioxygenase-like lactoylglutathione lyase family enzyme
MGSTMQDAAASRAVPLNRPFRLSHGTLECRDLALSRRFYEEFLGLDVVRHSQRSIMLRKGGYWAVVCVQIGEKAHPVRLLNHWGLDVESRAKVDEAHALAVAHKDEYDIGTITQPGEQHRVYSFYLQDRDGNWWEFQHTDADEYDQYFARGDVVPM